MRRLFVISFFSILLVYLVHTGLSQGFLRLPSKFQTVILPIQVQTSPQEIVSKINTYRLSHGLETLNSDSSICNFNPLGSNQNTSQFLTQCPTCSKVSLITVSKFLSPNELLTAFLNDESINQTLLSQDTNFLCPKENDENLLLFFAKKENQAANAAVTPKSVTPKTQITPAPPKNFSEAELWSALMAYRSAHAKTALSQDEALCTYVRKRLETHINMMAEKKPAEYPVPDKYPLDAHTGFSADAESGVAFDITQKNHLAENLAYWPDAQYPNQVIEWGWDSSTEGHREAQLSNDWTVGCIGNRNGFYVAIFGY